MSQCDPSNRQVTTSSRPILRMPQPSSLDTTTSEARPEIEYRNQLHASFGHFRRDFERPFELGAFCSITNSDGTDSCNPFLLRAERKEIAADFERQTDLLVIL